MMNTEFDKTAPAPTTEHPSAGEMAAYIDGVASDEERRRLDLHLSECDRCREELVVVREAMRSKGSRLRWVAGAVATAAAIVLLLLTPAMLQDGSDPILRGPDTADPAADVAGTIEVVSPLAAVGDAAIEPRFVWRSSGPGAQYRVTVTTTAGDAVATVTTSDTVITSLPDAELAPDTEYYWWVEALRADRKTAESGLQRFRTAP